MAEETKNTVNEQPVVDYDALINAEEPNTADPIEKLKKQAQENLDRLNGLPGAQDILQAFKACDDSGKRMTVVELRKSYFDLSKEVATHGYPELTTMEPEVQLEQCSGYTTVVLKFDYGRNAELNRIWHILEDYGKEQAELPVDAQEAPVMSISVVPMLLGGQYGMVAHDPIFYHMQPSDAMQNYCDEIRIVFEPGSVAFLRDNSFTSESVLEEVKRELAAEKLEEENRIKQQMEEEAYQKMRNKEKEEYRESERQERYRFTPSQKPNEKFQDSTGLRKQ